MPLESYVGASPIPPNDLLCIGVRMVQEPDSPNSPHLIACEVLVMRIESPSTSSPCGRHVQGTLLRLSAQKLPKTIRSPPRKKRNARQLWMFQSSVPLLSSPHRRASLQSVSVENWRHCFRKFNPHEKPSCTGGRIGGPKYVITVRSLILLGTALAVTRHHWIARLHTS